jgi:hypothetical protein
MAEWILIFTLKVFHGKNQIYHDDSTFKTFEQCSTKGSKEIKPYRGAMIFKCERKSK